MARYDLKIISLNVRGLNDTKKRKAVYQYLTKEKGDILFLQETYTSENDVNRWSHEWEGSSYYSHGTKHSCGVAILIRKNLNIDVIDHCTDKLGRYVILNIKMEDVSFNLLNLYSPSKEGEKVQFLSKMIEIMESKGFTETDNNIIGGDWNVTLEWIDKKGGKVFHKTKAVDEIDKLKRTF